MSDRIVNVAYFGGSHGAFLMYFVDRFSSLTPNIDVSPFLDTGTSHNLKVPYSDKVARYTFEDENGNAKNGYQLQHKDEPHILITIDEPSLMNYLRLHFLRQDDHEWTGTNVMTSHEGATFNTKFYKMYAGKFKTFYDIDLDKNSVIPLSLLRDFLKIVFLHPSHNGTYLNSKKTLGNINEHTQCISLSQIWDTDAFMKRMSEISDSLGLALRLDDEAVALHKEFLQKRPNHQHWNRIDHVIDCITQNTHCDCSELDIVEQGYLYAWLEKTHEFIQAPLTRNFFSDTTEIIEYLNYYPNHYKAMNPNLPKFNNIDNPFYLWAKNKGK
jgi:hypothetical protein